MTTYNLLPNPSFLKDLTGWSAYASGSGATAPTVSLDSSDPLYGTGYSAKVTIASGGPYGGIWSASGYRVPISAGKDYTFSAYVKVPVGQDKSDFSLRAYFYNASTGGVNTYVQSIPQTISSFDGWVRLVFSFTIPSTYNVSGTDYTPTHLVAFVFRNSSVAAVGYNFLVDALQLETGTTANLLSYDQGQKNKLVDTSLTNVYIDHLKGMKLKADIRLGDFVFNRIDEYGVVWVITDVTGWNNLPDVQIQDFPRGWGDGSFTSYGRYGARQITIAGSFLVQNADTQLEAARERLIEAINLVKKDAWLIMNEGTPKAVKVRLSAAPELHTTNARGRTDFSIGIVAADPIKYKWDDARDDGYKLVRVNNNPTTYTTIRNEGNTPVPVVFEIVGPTTGPTSIFNKTSEDLLGVISKLKRFTVFAVDGVELSSNLVANVTTNLVHGLAVNDTIEVLNVVDAFKVDKAEIKSGNNVDLTLNQKHNFSTNQRIYISGLSSNTGFPIANGDYAITAVYPTTNEFKLTITYGSSLTVKAETALTSATNMSVSANVSSAVYDSANTRATFTTSASHGFRVGDTVVVANTDQFYDGTFTVEEIPSTTTFTTTLYPQAVRSIAYYSTTYNSVTIYVSNSPDFKVVEGDYINVDGVNGEINGVYKVGTWDTVSNASYDLITYSKDITTVNTTPTASTYGTLKIENASIDRASASFSGKAYLGNRFNGTFDVTNTWLASPNVFSTSTYLDFAIPYSAQSSYTSNANAHVRVFNETLSIDTLNRELALNGEIGGYRSKLDTVIDWIYLYPGDNEINFTDKNKNYVGSVSYVTSTNKGTIVTKSDHNLVVGSTVTLSGLNSVNSNVFANANVTVVSVPNTQSITFTPALSYASNISSTTVNTGYIYEVGPSYVNIYYRSGWIG
jgi:hypothetical protein